MDRTTKLGWVLAAMAAVVLGIGLLQYAVLGRTTPSASPTAHQQSPANVPAAPPVPGIPAAPEIPFSAAPATTPADLVPSAPLPAPRVSPAPGTTAPVAPPSVPTTLTYVIQPHDSLWQLAATHLGTPLRWYQLYELNRGRAEPGGHELLNPNLIYPGWTLEFPAGAVGLVGVSTSGASGGSPA